ncbi:MAG TPA: hypothetical protein VM840_12595 [Actinomycetota bacterium]|nr:hypothetical protein [Actinomycetota bacterium]
MFSHNGSRKSRKKSGGKGRAIAVVLGFAGVAGAVAAAISQWRHRHDSGREQPYEGEDIVEHASMTSFPASDAPSY